MCGETIWPGALLTLSPRGMRLPRLAPAMDARPQVLVFDRAALLVERKTTRTCKADPAPASDRTLCRSSGPLRCRLRRFGLEGWRTHRDARMSCAGWCRKLPEHRIAAHHRQTQQGLAPGEASVAGEFRLESGATQCRQRLACPNISGSRSLRLKQA